MTYRISKQFHFSASHQLRGLPEDHPCSRLHGHNYLVDLVLAAEQLDSAGFVVDFNELSAFKQFIDHTLDHRHLNDVLPDNPTAEHIARFLYEWAKQRWPQVHSVEVSETAKCSARYGETL